MVAKRKPLGKCPHCEAMVQAIVIEENNLRRDVCVCPECSGKILVCRTPGCKDYALVGENYDDELCPDCMASVRDAAKTVVGTAALAAIPILVGKALSSDD